MKYRKKPEIIEAFQYKKHMSGDNNGKMYPDWFMSAFKSGICYYSNYGGSRYLYIKVADGECNVPLGSYIVKNEMGELRPYRPDIFESMYELVSD